MSTENSTALFDTAGSIATNGAEVELLRGDDAHTVVQITGTWVGTLAIKASNDGSTFNTLNVLTASLGTQSTITTSGTYTFSANGYKTFKIQATVWTSGTANIFSCGSDASSIIYSSSKLVRGSDGTEIGTSTAPVRIDPTGTTTQPVASGINSGGTQGAITMTTAGTTYAAQVGGSPLANRKLLTINPTTADIYFGYTNAVTTSSGTKIFKDQFFPFDLNPNASVTIYLVSASSNVNVRITESP